MYKSAVVLRVQVDVNVASELTVFVADHRRATGERNLRHLLNRYLRPGWSGNEHSIQLSGIIAEIAQVTNVNGITLATLDVLRHVHAADARGNCLLHVGDGQPVLGRVWTIALHV